jgi:hypothetical protein
MKQGGNTMNYTVYVGGERRDRLTDDTDRANVARMLNQMRTDACYTRMLVDGRYIGQAEHVLPLLIAVSYISGDDDMYQVLEILGEWGITRVGIQSGTDEEATNGDYLDLDLQ